MKIIDVTCALIIQENNILACKRGINSEHPNEWEFPGGKVEPNESEEECIIRELKEELAIDVTLVRKMQQVEHHYPKKLIRLIPFQCEIKNGEPKAIEHAQICWQPIADFEQLNWSEADRILFHLNKEYIK